MIVFCVALCIFEIRSKIKSLPVIRTRLTVFIVLKSKEVAVFCTMIYHKQIAVCIAHFAIREEILLCLRKAIGTDEPMMSRFENYKCLPVPEMMRALLRELDCSIEDIYEPHEVYLQMTVAPKKRKHKSNVYRLTAELPKEAKDLLNSGALQKCGYKDITAWVNHCYERFKKQYDEILAKEKDSTTATTQKK